MTDYCRCCRYWWQVAFPPGFLSWEVQILADMLQEVGEDIHELKKEARKMSAETQAAIDELKAEVEPITDAVKALSAVIDNFIKQIEDAGDDPAEIRAVTASFKSNREELVRLALKGTPAAPPVEPAPEPAPQPAPVG